MHIAEHFYRQTALCDLFGVPSECVDDNRLYRGLDELLPHKPALEAFLKRRFGELFAKIAAACARSPQQTGAIERRVGRLLGQNSRAAGLFDIRIRADERGAAQIEWTKVERWRTWSQLSEGAYVLRSNVRDWAVDVVLPTRNGPELSTRCITQPNEHQQILLHHLGLSVPSHLRKTDL